MSKNTSCPQFDKYTLVGDTRAWEQEGFDMCAVIREDCDTRPSDFDCYSDEEKAAWLNDEWRFVGVVVTASLAGTVLGDASLWGIDCNHPAGDNAYLAEVANELSSEAIAEAKRQANRVHDAHMNALEIAAGCTPADPT